METTTTMQAARTPKKVRVTVDQDLMCRVQLLLQVKPGKGKLGWDKQECLLDMVEQYEVACDLSGGPVPNRSAHWATKAMEWEHRLRAKLDTLDGGFKPSEKR